MSAGLFMVKVQLLDQDIVLQNVVRSELCAREKCRPDDGGRGSIVETRQAVLLPVNRRKGIGYGTVRSGLARQLRLEAH